MCAGEASGPGTWATAAPACWCETFVVAASFLAWTTGRLAGHVLCSNWNPILTGSTRFAALPTTCTGLMLEKEVGPFLCTRVLMSMMWFYRLCCLCFARDWMRFTWCFGPGGQGGMLRLGCMLCYVMSESVRVFPAIMTCDQSCAITHTHTVPTLA